MAAVAASSAPGFVADAEAAAASPSPGEAEPVGESVPGYGRDPNLTALHKRGDFWPLTLSAEQRHAAKALADTIIPHDEYGPAAGDVGVVEMIDEWVSAPYPRQRADRPLILSCLKWIDAESQKRFSKRFHELSEEQKHAICDDICYRKNAAPAFKQAAGYFSKFRTLAASAYYATPEGWKAIGYVGNVALGSFDGPPKEVLDRLGVTQTVKV